MFPPVGSPSGFTAEDSEAERIFREAYEAEAAKFELFVVDWEV